MDAPLWVPPTPERTQMDAFRRFAASKTGHHFPDYDALWQWSVRDPDAFWSLWLERSGIALAAPPVAVRSGGPFEGTVWFPGARLNLAGHLLRFRGEAPALIARDEAGRRSIVTRDGLRQAVASVQVALRRAGVQPGDRVAAVLPHREEAVVAMLATVGLGAIWSSTSPDFGTRGVLDRFEQIAPKVLIVTMSSRYGGRVHDHSARNSELEHALGAQLITVGSGGSTTPWSWEEIVTHAAGEPHIEAMPFDAPAAILYSSGTTGTPKGIVHGHGGILLQHTKELSLHGDVGEGDVLFYFTTAGWMMWNWQVSGLGVGASLVLWDGSPVLPRSDALYEMAAEERVTHFGTSPKFVSMCAQEALEPGRDHDLSHLRTVFSTGSPLPAEGFVWLHEHVSKAAQIASICGGTDLIGCFMLGVPTEPVYAGEIQRRGLGMAVEAFDDEGKPVRGRAGELVCTKPFPSMPVAFWNDPEGRRYHDAYFAQIPGVWHHGDYVEITDRGGVIVLGRSDATLNPGGVRIGTAEILRQVELVSEIADALVVGLPTADGDVRVVLFVVPRPGVILDDALSATIRSTIRRNTTPRHVPAAIHDVPAIPRTRSGKTVEIAVTRVLTGRPIANREALANPEALDWFADRAGSF